MKTSFRKYILAAALTATVGTMMAQDLNSAYFTDDFKYRHDMNAAYGNDQGYVAIPILGNFGMRLQGSLGVGDVLFKNPYYGNPKYPNAKKTATFLHPGISADEALKGISKDGNDLILDMDLPIVSVGFKGFGGYNTIELKERTHVGLSVPYSFFDFAKNMANKEYSFDDLGARGWTYAELGFGHSRQIMDNLRVGAKVKLLFGGAYADFSMDGVKANMVGNKWILSGKARGELNMKGGKFKTEEKEYKGKEGTYSQVNGIDTDGAGLSGFGLGLEYNDGSFENGGDKIQDDLADFAHLEAKDDEAGKSKALAATVRLGVEYPLPVYDKITFGLLGTHRFDGIYSWSEGRLSANYTPLKWLDGGMNVAFTSYCTTMGWVLNVHPKGFNVFMGMDHMIGKTGASGVPLDSNVSFNFGMNVTF